MQKQESGRRPLRQAGLFGRTAKIDVKPATPSTNLNNQFVGSEIEVIDNNQTLETGAVTKGSTLQCMISTIDNEINNLDNSDDDTDDVSDPETWYAKLNPGESLKRPRYVSIDNAKNQQVPRAKKLVRLKFRSNNNSDNSSSNSTLKNKLTIAENKIPFADEVLIPAMLSDDPVSSCSEDSTNGESDNNANMLATAGRKRNRRVRKQKKSQNMSGNTLFKLWNIKNPVNASPVLQSSESILGKPKRASRIVKLKLGKTYLEKIAILSSVESNTLIKLGRPVFNNSTMKFSSSWNKRQKRKEFVLVSDNEGKDDLAHGAEAEVNYVLQDDKDGDNNDHESINSDQTPPTPPRSSDSDDNEIAKNMNIEEKKLKPSGRPMHSFFSKKKNVITKKQSVNEVIDCDVGLYSKIENSRLNDNGIKKNMHPFFIGGVKPRFTVDENSQYSDSSANDTDGMQQLNAKVWDPPGAKEPRWPSLFDRHVIGHGSGSSNLNLHIEKRPRKLKRVFVDYAGNDCLARKQESISELFSNMEITRLLPYPKRLVMNTEELQALALKHVNLSAHPYLEYLFSRWLSQQNAFDRADYEDQLWTAKYAPIKALQVAVANDSALILKKWLRARMNDNIDRSKTITTSRMRMIQKQLKQQDSLDGFITYSDEENEKFDFEPISSSEDDYEGYQFEHVMNHDVGKDSSTDDDDNDFVVRSRRLRKRKSIKEGTELQRRRKSRLRPLSERPSRHANVLILCGKSASGKTSSVQAIVQEMGYFAFEIHAGQRRSGKDIVDQFGEMSQSHLVHKSTSGSEENGKPAEFKQKSLLFVEDVDVLFEEDKGFWPTLVKFLETSKRPVVLTCTDKYLLPPELVEIYSASILEFLTISNEIKMEMMWLIALCEGHLLEKRAVQNLIDAAQGDLRAAVSTLQLWCQMAVGDERKGLNWVLPRTHESDLNELAKMRVISQSTFTTEFVSLSYDKPVVSHNQRQHEVQAQGRKFSVKDWDVLENSLELRSAADIWAAHSHTFLDVPLMPNAQEPYGWWPTPAQDHMMGLPMVGSELSSQVEPYPFELDINSDAELISEHALQNILFHAG
ncbi:hypothetical protein V1514DRAFT_367509 [Lipomyces japonicus]|uniref:uncharacterized protein n=1 Tax=Lipomyces japonicus TaxID=56871 RepID=UPI0034CDEEEE